jgi:hypothetical protein
MRYEVCTGFKWLIKGPIGRILWKLVILKKSWIPALAGRSEFSPSFSQFL